ncbi:cob(I)yrinic acid a,c-diamide adenosyltransferase [Lysobacter gummosus]|uniref:cob(I)yrinic acid a,c-diamide adenosyltransferase n=2 Tax=Lysobacteraceae TaxID=32033 RepID=UPI002285A8C4|nr:MULTISPECIES: cob(I)yrinic acid a,c-diamide adenosyltransferase [Lysobacter]
MSEEKHRERMQRKKELIDRKIAKATIERGVLVVNTGNGKGKSSSGFGMLARSLGHGFKCGVVQFIKGSFSTGEEAFFRRFEELDYHVMGEGFTWETQDKQRDIAAAQAAWAISAKMMSDEAYDFVLLDELNIALAHRYVALDDVLAAVAARPPRQHVVITGRGAPDALIEAADTVTEMRVIKHAFKAGIKAQQGIEL